MKKIGWIVVLVLFLISGLQSVEASPYLASSGDKTHWKDHFGNNTYSMTSGKRLTYDIYEDKYIDGGYDIVTEDFGKGSQKYIKFYGWAVVFGRQQHTPTNHETFIVVKKRSGEENLGQTKVYTTTNLERNATEDLEYNNQGSGIWNECPSSALNKDNLQCNMRYERVNFRSYIPLKDLFPNEYEDAVWDVFISKRVGSWYVYSPLKTPFSFKNRAYNGGEISFKSGVDGGYLSTTDYPVIRRSYPRQTAASAPNIYFTKYRQYQMIDKDEGDTTLWFGLKTPEDDNKKRWGNSVYFGVSGQSARISFNAPEEPVEIPPKPEKPDGTCKAPVLPADRYKYELDLVAQTIDAKVTDSNKTTTTKVSYKRNNYAAKREAAKQDIEDDIEYRKALKSQKEAELKTEKATYSQQEKDYAAASKDEDEDRANAIVAQMAVTLQKIANLECSIQTINVEIAHYEKEKNSIITKENATKSVTTTTQLKFDDDTILSTQSITLQESEVKTLSYTWTLKNSGDVTGIINPNGETFAGVAEKTLKNNTITTEIRTATNETVEMCSPLGETSTLQGLVRTVNDRTNGYTEYNESITTQVLMSEKDRTRKAGYGFDYQLETIYENEDPESTATGVKTSRSYFPVLTDYLPYVKKSSKYGELWLSGYEIGLLPYTPTLWSLPNSYVETFSGNVFESMTSTNVNRNPNDKLIAGGTKFYIPFNYPNRTLTFDTIALDAGVNHMNTCVTADVNVSGSALNDKDHNDDFYSRSLSPTNPFPNGIGWNFNTPSTRSLFDSSLNNWYSNFGYNGKNKYPYDYSFKLTQETISKIQAYNRTHPYIKKGESVLDSVAIPRR